MSLSAADTRWTDLLKMLAKLNNGVSYTDKDIEEQHGKKKQSLFKKTQLHAQDILITGYKNF